MAKRNEVQTALDTWARSAGLAKQSGSWYLAGHDVVSVVNLQKSQYGQQYYVNVCAWLQTLGHSDFPKENECHVRARLENLLPDVRDQLPFLLDLTQDCSDRGGRLTSLLDGQLLPLLGRMGSLAGLRELFREGRFKSAAIRGPALIVLQEG